MNPVDDITLSCYLDGELDYASAENVTDLIQRDPDTREKLMGMVTSQALLKSFGWTKTQEEIPPKLIQALEQKSNKRTFLFRDKAILQAAAVILLFVSSYFFGRQSVVGPAYEASLFPVIPASLEQTINNVLEYQKSGTTQSWVEMSNGVSARVTPVKSFRSSKGEFYRMYLIDLDETGKNQHFWAMAIRSGKEKWQTRGVFANGTPGSI